MVTPTGLSGFLRSRRAGLHPQDVGLPDVGIRRVSGLRREEIAELCGVSVDYYTRMEQGRALSPSRPVLDALAQGLRLDGEETRHLYRLAHRQSGSPEGPESTQQVRPMLRRLLAELDHLPALVMGRRMDVLAWNTAADHLFGGFSASGWDRPNIARTTFLDPASRHLYLDWQTCARENVAFLHLDAGRHPGDRRLAALVGELADRSPDFRRWWAEHPVRDKTSGTKRFRHPLVGEIELGYETLRPADDPDQALITYAAAAGSPSEDAARLLAAWPGAEPSAFVGQAAIP